MYHVHKGGKFTPQIVNFKKCDKKTLSADILTEWALFKEKKKKKKRKKA